MNNKIRPAQSADLPALTEIWHQGWHQAHADHVPATLTQQRTKASFKTRMEQMLPEISTLGPTGAPIGFCAIRGNEIYQIYVGKDARGTGAAGALIADGLRRIFAEGHTIATLDVVPENTRAIAFYQKMGWQKQSVGETTVDTLTGPYPLRCLIMTIYPA